ncbi:hypothetical protein CHS0354_001188 [Potamilus streckersoni]|uniref:Uncharacterized protein n=1 Tax=Potamilus streckersoni TaxID=2493646 RepID=A0AAE0T691_9BIVA|nr:hypothetical protein CHS0354_001188 [Potamilus streckersoni]
MDYKRKWVRDTQNDAREKQGLPNNATRDYKRQNARFCKAKEINTRHGVIMARCEEGDSGQAILNSSTCFAEISLYQKERLYLILIAKQPKRSENNPTKEL